MGQKGTSSPQQWSEQSTHSCIWSGRRLDDQQRNPNMNNKDHLVGQLTSARDTCVSKKKMHGETKKTNNKMNQKTKTKNKQFTLNQQKMTRTRTN